MMRPFVVHDAFREQCGIATYFTTAWKCSRQPRDIDLKRFEATLVGDFIAMVTRHTLARVCRSTAQDRRRGDYVVDASLPHGMASILQKHPKATKRYWPEYRTHLRRSSAYLRFWS